MNACPFLAASPERPASDPGSDLAAMQPAPGDEVIVEAAARAFGLPISFISLTGEQGIWLAARRGIDAHKHSRMRFLCVHALVAGTCVIVEDAARDDRFSEHHLVSGEPGIRFYAGQPIIDLTGAAIGVLSLADTVPRPDIRHDDLDLLGRLARLIAQTWSARRELRVQSAVSGFAQSSGMAIITTDQSGAITFWNTAAEQMFGHAQREIAGRDISVIIPERFREDHHRGLARISAGGEARLVGRAVEVVGLHRDGHEFPIEISLSSWAGVAGREFGAQIQDISARHARDTKLRHLAVHDALTGLPNRREFNDRLIEALANHGSAAVLMLDLDGFKGVNDALGHLTGDDLLRMIAVRLAARLPEGALLARMGGDEFAVLLPDCDDPVRTRRVGEALCAAFDDDYSVGGHELRLSTSAGYALAPLHASDAEELLLRADLALIEAKRDAGRTLRIFDRGLENKLYAQRAFRDEVRQATVESEWRLFYQPMVRLTDGALAGAEALLRWLHPTRGLITPGVFLDTLEQHAVAAELGRWIIDEACSELVRIRRQGIALPSISVNLFAIQLRSSGIERTVLSLLERHGLSADDLELELTETVMLRQDARCLSELRALRSAGVRLAFDDFGTGFASLATLKGFPVDKLKIDRSFTKDLTRNAHSRAIVGSIIHLARELGIAVVAEGVETATQRDAMRDLGCSIGQGYLWGKPVESLIYSAGLDQSSRLG